MTSRLRIAVADDHELFREALKSSLDSAALHVVAEIGRDDDLGTTLEGSACDVLLLDLDGPHGSPDEIGRLAPGMRVVGLTDREETDHAITALRAGARGIVFKRLAVRSLVECIAAVAAGHALMHPAVQAALLASTEASDAQPLTGREREIVPLLAAGGPKSEDRATPF